MPFSQGKYDPPVFLQSALIGNDTDFDLVSYDFSGCHFSLNQCIIVLLVHLCLITACQDFYGKSVDFIGKEGRNALQFLEVEGVCFGFEFIDPASILIQRPDIYAFFLFRCFLAR